MHRKLLLSRATASLTLAFLCSVAGAQVDSPNVLFMVGGRIDSAGNPIVVAGQRVPGYTTGIVSPYDGTSVVISRVQPDPALGFVAAPDVVVTQPLPGPPAQYEVLLNQTRPDLATFFAGTSGEDDPFGVTITPSPGTFDVPIVLSLRAAPGATILYKIGSGPEQNYSAPFPLAEDAVVTFRATDGGTFGPSKTAAYSFSTTGCEDFDGDGLPDWLESLLGIDPTLPADDHNANGLPDVQDVQRGSDLSTPDLPADSDADGWSDLDEGLRGTAPADPQDFPTALTLDSVEVLLGGTVTTLSPGGSAPPSAGGAPDPAAWSISVFTPTGRVLREPQVLPATNFSTRFSGDDFRFLHAEATDGTGRVLLALIPPAPLCLPENCPSSRTIQDWRTSWETAMAGRVTQPKPGVPVSPRSTAEALLLSALMEGILRTELTARGVENLVPHPLRDGARQAPGEENLLASEISQAFNDRGRLATWSLVQSGVTPAMLDVLNDYTRLQDAPLPRNPIAIVRDIFAGEAVQPEEIPSGARTDRFAAAAADVAAFVAMAKADSLTISGTVSLVDGIPTLTPPSGPAYRLRNFSEPTVDGSTYQLTLRPDVDDCGTSPTVALVLSIEQRSSRPAAVATDSDSDGLPDSWELLYFGNLDPLPGQNPDDDSLNNLQEYTARRNPIRAEDAPARITAFAMDATTLTATHGGVVLPPATFGEVGFWYRRLLPSRTPWVYLGLTRFNPGTTVTRRAWSATLLPGETWEASARLRSNRAWLGDYSYATYSIPGTPTSTPTATATPSTTPTATPTATTTVTPAEPEIFSLGYAAGRLIATHSGGVRSPDARGEIGFWVRRTAPSLTAWTYLGITSYAPGETTSPRDWTGGATGETWQALARLRVNRQWFGPNISLDIALGGSTATPSATPTATATPTAIASPTPSSAPNPIFSLSGDSTSLVAVHGGVQTSVRSAIGFWYRTTAPTTSPWVYLGRVPYASGVTTTRITWDPRPGTTYQTATRSWDYANWSGPYFYSTHVEP